MGSGDHEGHFAMLPAGRPYSDFNVLAQGREKVHKTLDREVARLPAHQAGNMGLFDAQYLASRRLGEIAVFDKPVDLQCEAGLELLTFRVREAEVSKNVATPLFDPDFAILLNLSSAFLCGRSLPQ